MSTINFNSIEFIPENLKEEPLFIQVTQLLDYVIEEYFDNDLSMSAQIYPEILLQIADAQSKTVNTDGLYFWVGKMKPGVGTKFILELLVDLIGDAGSLYEWFEPDKNTKIGLYGFHGETCELDYLEEEERRLWRNSFDIEYIHGLDEDLWDVTIEAINTFKPMQTRLNTLRNPDSGTGLKLSAGFASRLGINVLSGLPGIKYKNVYIDFNRNWASSVDIAAMYLDSLSQFTTNQSYETLYEIVNDYLIMIAYLMRGQTKKENVWNIARTWRDNATWEYLDTLCFDVCAFNRMEINWDTADEWEDGNVDWLGNSTGNGITVKQMQWNTPYAGCPTGIGHERKYWVNIPIKEMVTTNELGSPPS